MQGLASREAALRILLEQENGGAFLKDLFGRHTEPLSKPDRALVRELCLGVVRNLTLLDYNIDRHAARKPGPGALRTLLRLSAYQLFFMDVPAFAAVNVAVEIAKRRWDRHQAGFVNAVLKKLGADGLQKHPGDSLKALAVNHSHPEWMVKRWHKRLGRAGLLRALERDNEEAPLWIRVNPLRMDAPSAARALAAIGVETESESGTPYLRVTGKGGGEKALHSELFVQGAIAFQDPAAWLIAELADWRAGESALDLCSAPGGKAACLIERARHTYGDRPHSHETDRGERRVVCNDISFPRLARIRDAVERLGHKGLLPVVFDPARPALRTRFDLIIVDAPCSNLGVLRRRPEARWNRRPADLARLASIQRGLLEQAAGLCSPRGRIVYATCSPEDEETAEVVRAFLAAHPEWRSEDAANRLPPWAVKEGFLWLHPGESEYDGFFAAHLARA